MHFYSVSRDENLAWTLYQPLVNRLFRLHETNSARSKVSSWFMLLEMIFSDVTNGMKYMLSNDSNRHKISARAEMYVFRMHFSKQQKQRSRLTLLEDKIQYFADGWSHKYKLSNIVLCLHDCKMVFGILSFLCSMLWLCFFCFDEIRSQGPLLLSRKFIIKLRNQNQKFPLHQNAYACTRTFAHTGCCTEIIFARSQNFQDFCLSISHQTITGMKRRCLNSYEVIL